MQRRKFISGLTSTLLGSLAMAGSSPSWKTLPRFRDGAALRGTARNLIFVFLEGGPCHIDTFDLKTGPHNPEFFNGRYYGDLFWPTGVMPKLASRTNQFSIIRSLSGLEVVHSRAVYQLLTAHRFNEGLIQEVPHFASTASYMLAHERQESHTLPAVITIDNRVAGNGFRPVEHLGLDLGRGASVPDRKHSFIAEHSRFNLLSDLLEDVSVSDKRKDAVNFFHQARELMNDQELAVILDELDDRPLGDVSLEAFLHQCSFAHRMLAADKGARIIQLKLPGWDHHRDIYKGTDDFSLVGRCRFLDAGLSQLLDDLEGSPSVHSPGKTLLDETLVVAMGEFGRTVGPLNGINGRDHYPYVIPAFIAGGGVVGGRVIGATTPDGAAITDLGWSHNRYMSVLDLTATLYSA